MVKYIINGKTQVGWRIDELADNEGEAQALGLDFLRSYVAFVREKQMAEMIVALLNDATAIDASAASPAERAPKALSESAHDEERSAPGRAEPPAGPSDSLSKTAAQGEEK